MPSTGQLNSVGGVVQIRVEPVRRSGYVRLKYVPFLPGTFYNGRTRIWALYALRTTGRRMLASVAADDDNRGCRPAASAAGLFHLRCMYQWVSLYTLIRLVARSMAARRSPSIITVSKMPVRPR